MRGDDETSVITDLIDWSDPTGERGGSDRTSAVQLPDFSSREIKDISSSFRKRKKRQRDGHRTVGLHLRERMNEAEALKPVKRLHEG